MDQPRLKPDPQRRFTVPISWKLLGATAIVGCVAAVIAVIGLNWIHRLNQNLVQTVDFLADNVKTAALVKQDLFTATRAERNMMLAQSEDGTERFAAVVDEAAAALDGRLEQLRALGGSEDHRLLDRFAAEWRKWLHNHRDVRRFTAIDSDIEARNISVGAAQTSVDRMERGLAVLVDAYEAERAAARAAGDDDRRAAAAETLAAVSAVSRASLAVQRAEKDLILAPSEVEMARYVEAAAARRDELRRRIDQLKDALGGEHGATLAEVEQAHAEFVEAHQLILSVAGEKSNFLAYHFVYDVGIPIAVKCESILDQLIARNEQRMESHREMSQQAYATARNTLLGISVCGILASLAISLYTGHRIAQRLSLLSRFARMIQTTGDLSAPVPVVGTDEVGMLAEAFDQMRQSLLAQTRDLNAQTERLKELTESLEVKNHEMEQFVYTISHDLKSPLVSCAGLLGLLKEDVAEQNDAAILESTTRMESALNQLNQIIDDLLMISRIGRKPLDLSEIDVNALLDDLLGDLADRVQRAEARVKIQPRLPALRADALDVRRVFENLLTNALKYGCREPGAEIEVGGAEVGDESRYFVRDNGPGIDPQYHDRIFGLFQRLETEPPGTGLGLASVARIMAMHGGRAWVESRSGEGATFWIAFANAGHLNRAKPARGSAK